MRTRAPFLLFLSLYLLFALGTFRDFGATWDEPEAYQAGRILYDHVVHGAPITYLDPEHSYPHTFFLRCLTPRADYPTYHFMNLLSALSLFWMVFELLLAQYGKPWLALLGPLFLFLNLPFLGSIPANPKDVPFAVFYFLSLGALYLFEEKLPGFKARWAVLGALFAVTISSRILGFTLFPLMIFYDLFYRHWLAPKLK